jgi:UDP-hydrolysing UDP-N-acetyl-D-glucosamine 2-epimerase
MPIAHIHGGEITEGAIDDALRHAITKFSHLHFVATERAARRVVQMGEEPWRVTISGAPGLDHVHSLQLPDRKELEELVGLDFTPPPLLVTYHPVTLEPEETETQVANLLGALAEVGHPIVFTYPNADTHNRLIRRMLREFVGRHPQSRIVENLGTRAYFGMMRQAAAMVGNSSSGIIEAASFKLPVVNVGNRQAGREHGRNVIDVGYGREEILQGMRTVLSAGFRTSLADLVNPYGDGHAAERIVERLADVELGDRLIRKRFHHTRGEIVRR